VAYEAYERCQLDMLYNYNVSQKVYKLGLPSPAVSVKGVGGGDRPTYSVPGVRVRCTARAKMDIFLIGNKCNEKLV